MEHYFCQDLIEMYFYSFYSVLCYLRFIQLMMLWMDTCKNVCVSQEMEVTNK